MQSDAYPNKPYLITMKRRYIDLISPVYVTMYNELTVEHPRTKFKALRTYPLELNTNKKVQFRVSKLSELRPLLIKGCKVTCEYQK